MSRINWILNSTLISKPELRDDFLRFLEKKFNENNQVNSFNDITVSQIFDGDGNFRIEICNYILEAKIYLFFEHNAKDESLQKLIFLFLRYTQHQYPDRESWDDFLSKTQESQHSEITKGIQIIWIDMQRDMITNAISTAWHSNESYHDLSHFIPL